MVPVAIMSGLMRPSSVGPIDEKKARLANRSAGNARVHKSFLGRGNGCEINTDHIDFPTTLADLQVLMIRSSVVSECLQYYESALNHGSSAQCTCGQGVGKELSREGHARCEAVPQGHGSAKGQRSRANADAAGGAVWLHPEEASSAVVGHQHSHGSCLLSIADLEPKT